MISQLRRIFDEHRSISASLIRADAATPSPSTYCARFSSLDLAYQQAFEQERRRVGISSIDHSTGFSLARFGHVVPRLPLRRRQ
jgi:hypothetical protein